ncbi:MAG: hypothetical protein LPK09_06835 [Hymenobacteraceae bacterium]|nr:hypothetical protein [Hymenobacteraceae bacterium]
MNTVAIIVSLIALIGAGFAFLRASSSHRILIKRIEKLKDSNRYLEEKLRKLEGSAVRSKRGSDDSGESGRRNKPRQEEQELTREPKQKQRDRQPKERPQQERQSQQEEHTTGQQRRKKENRRRNEPIDRNRTVESGNSEQQKPASSNSVNLEIVGADLLAELEQEAAGQQTSASNQFSSQPEPEQNRKKYAIIPEDGVIRQHQLQQQPDSDSYIEVDPPAEGSSRTHYRFNLSGNHAFVISQGIDRLENAFAFEKPSNRMVSQVVLQGDGVLSRVGNGWKIEEKARIDFR